MTPPKNDTLAARLESLESYARDLLRVLQEAVDDPSAEGCEWRDAADSLIDEGLP